jgi:hypothetical protein
MTEEIVDGDTKDTEILEETPKEETPKETPKDSELEDRNKQLFERAKKAEAEAKTLRSQLEKKDKPQEKGLDVEDYIDISASLEGLDQREKTKLAQEHKLTGKTLTEIRASEDFQLWQSAYKAKVEKEKALNPSTKQTDTVKEKDFGEKMEELRGGNPFAVTPEMEALAEKEGVWRNPQNSRFKK